MTREEFDASQLQRELRRLKTYSDRLTRAVERAQEKFPAAEEQLTYIFNSVEIGAVAVREAVEAAAADVSPSPSPAIHIP